jgi:hypothetical protein
MMLLAALPISKLLPFAIFGLFAIGAWFVLETLAARKPRAQERLDELRNPHARRKDSDPRATKRWESSAAV